MILLAAHHNDLNNLSLKYKETRITKIYFLSRLFSMFLINRHQGCFLIFPWGIWFVSKISQNLAYVSYKVSLMNHNECNNPAAQQINMGSMSAGVQPKCPRTEDCEAVEVLCSQLPPLQVHLIGFPSCRWPARTKPVSE